MLIAIDHGNKLIKTVHHTPFTSGLVESEVAPFGEDALRYQGKYYTLSKKRIPYHRDKTEDERFFILTLFAIAYEIEAMGEYSNSVMRVQLAVGLPPAHYGAQHRAFTDYFAGRGAVRFEFHKKVYAIYIEKVMCFPQSYAAALTVLRSISASPKSMIIDIGGLTVDYLRMQHGAGDLSVCDSLENGVIVLYNRIRSRVNAELDILLEESEIDAILQGHTENMSEAVVELVRRQAQAFVNDLFSTLRERGIELKSGIIVFAGGGSVLLRRQIEASGKTGRMVLIEDVRANARGYEMLYQLSQEGR